MKVHATNMKPFTGRKSILTPYAEPGFDRYQANERVVPKPLVLSPDKDVNETARVRFQKKSVGRLRRNTEAVNSREDMAKRDREVRDHISASQNEEWVINEDLDWKDDNESILPQEESDNDDNNELGQGSPPNHHVSPTTSSSTRIHDDATEEVETNMLHVEDSKEPSIVCWEEDFQDRARNISANWDKAIGRKLMRSRKRILDVANISEIDLELDPHMKERIEMWIDDITTNEQSRCSRLSRSQLRKESMTTSMEERIGLKLQGRELQWQGKQISRKHDSGTYPSQLDQYCGLSEVVTPVKEVSNLSDHIPDVVATSQVTMDSNRQVIVEECNLLNVEIWNTKEDKEPAEDIEEDEISISSEDSFDRERWHRSVLKACTQHASKLNLSIYEPISFDSNRETHKLRVELDADIPIPTNYRTLWYQVQHDIRRFYKLGLLYPMTNHSLEPHEHWRNNSQQAYRYIPQGIYLRILSVPTATLKTLFPPDYKGRVTMVTDTPRTKITILDVSAIHKKYDLWYWTAMRTARTMDVDPSSPRRAYAKLRGHSRKEANNMNVSEWRAHHYYMWEAIQRNKLLREPPKVITEGVCRC
jgi:hypothetical protein